MTFISYAQNFEDVMLHRVLGHVARGFYVDIGAQHPIDDSVTKAFSVAGWRGINIEPVRQWFDMLVSDRPHDLNLNVAIGEKGELRLFEVQGTGLSTTDAELAARYQASGKEVFEHVVPAVTLDSVLAEHGVDEVHFLKVDCEGAERAALASFSFDRVRPWVVVVEATEPNSQIGNEEKWEDILLDHAYILAYYDGLNRYYVPRERDALLASFAAPPNVFDDFIRARDQAAHDALHDLHFRAHDMVQELTSLRPTVAQLAASLDAANRQHDERIALAVAKEADLRSGLDSLAEQAASASARVTDLEHAMALLRVETGADHMDAERRKAERTIADLRAREAAFHAEVSRRDDYIHSLLTSSSWRITAPWRGIRLVANKVARGSWRLVRPVVVRVVRAAIPAMRAMLRIPGVRPVVARALGPHTRIGRRIRAFFAPAPHPGDATFVAPEALTEQGQAMEVLLKRMINRRTEG
ncbi:FkbM family methyltransferase [Luteibacter aegosomaticola]|uniref:FkbM family methyltransferase n=1 Tax=Luteibacter aegosomaticola TaxID=2911538 RepID=UPI001FFB91BC|nr:FkbM family methyltransferase [Luteibacter aegosomaticola]UPG91107.1 FkbM family methyltransferase [Luteibacter aegosomaticola]